MSFKLESSASVSCDTTKVGTSSPVIDNPFHNHKTALNSSYLSRTYTFTLGNITTYFTVPLLSNRREMKRPILLQSRFTHVGRAIFTLSLFLLLLMSPSTNSTATWTCETSISGTVNAGKPLNFDGLCGNDPSFSTNALIDPSTSDALRFTVGVACTTVGSQTYDFQIANYQTSTNTPSRIIGTGAYSCDSSVTVDQIYVFDFDVKQYGFNPGVESQFYLL